MWQQLYGKKLNVPKLLQDQFNYVVHHQFNKPWRMFNQMDKQKDKGDRQGSWMKLAQTRQAQL